MWSHQTLCSEHGGVACETNQAGNITYIPPSAALLATILGNLHMFPVPTTAPSIVSRTPKEEEKVPCRVVKFTGHAQARPQAGMQL